MPEIVDPTDSLISFQQALSNGSIRLSPCVVHTDMKVLLDDANGTPRITYAFVQGETVKGVAVYVPVDPVEGKPCFGVGYAVADEFKMQGVCTKLLTASIEEMQYGFRNSFSEFYVEAIVGVDNQASNKLASKVLSVTPESGKDSHSGKPINQYMKLFSTTK
ncbi:GNAT family N-acetyltransferase [Leclercia adecarboxylata]|uniref:GNAT family N-acetyltransferase n=1 Tax=Leclercia adecarboxylata TaxID=83655 RepID=UPI001E32E060|nr:GNAT family N-acetyltransferase [Leclercia adecarboxylata]UFM68545.1 GNAT family N-acetyltransferase [Leclercia adecarboxylata]